MNLYRIIQEALNNINKYANATIIELILNVNKNVLFLEIKDNGIGFNVNKVKSGIGLKNMRNRAKTMNGEINIDSEKDKGTIIMLKIHI
jgi:signal transduction histidine kinase